ncbi:MAG TPA: hypothetical protein PKA64_13650, partial [Myxococcota bacterium]|nr:hypothetical protein [Myxococcota bacterium]
SVRERARDGWRLVTRPLLQIDQGRPGRLAIGTQRVISASEGDARWVTTRAVELHVELLPDAPAAGPRVLHLATFAEPDAEAFGVPVAGGLRCPAELVVVDGDRGAVVAPPQREGTWSCELLRPGAPPEPITIDLRVW